jgi:hypothetical protein
MIWTDQEISKHKKEIYALSFSLLLLFALYGILMAKAIQRIAPN